jgi:hypothetical protein
MKFFRSHLMLMVMGFVQVIEGAILVLSFGCIQTRFAVRIAINQLRKAGARSNQELARQIAQHVENTQGAPNGTGGLKWPKPNQTQCREAAKRAERVTKAL